MAETTHAIVIKGPKEATIQEVPIPSLDQHPAYILVKVAAIALNPTDWKHIDFLATPGTRVGCDYAGTIIDIGSEVKKPFKIGDRVAGFCHGSSALHLDYGCFANIIVAKGDLSIVIPPNLSFEEAATLGVGITTVGQGLYQSLKLPLPPATAKDGRDILIYGGSTATGGLAIQFAKLSGLRVLTTCSPGNFAYVKELGAEEVFDYKSESVVQDISKAADGKLSLVFDCLSGGDSRRISVQSMAKEGGLYSALDPGKKRGKSEYNENVEEKDTLAYTAIGEDIKIGGSVTPAKKEDLEFGGMFWELSRELLAKGQVKVHKPSVDEEGSGLEGALKGLDLLRKGKVSGRKLVYKL